MKRVYEFWYVFYVDIIKDHSDGVDNHKLNSLKGLFFGIGAVCMSKEGSRVSSLSTFIVFNPMMFDGQGG